MAPTRAPAELAHRDEPEERALGRGSLRRSGGTRLPGPTHLEAECHQQQITLLTRQIKRVVGTISPTPLDTDPVQHLLWIPGIGRINASSIYLEIDDITRFPSTKQFLSYARLVP